MTNMRKKIVILGSSGFIGKRLYAQLPGQCLSYRVNGFSSKDCNLLNKREVLKVLSSIGPNDTLIIAAAISRLQENTPTSMKKNIRMIQNLIDVFRQNPPGYVIYLSSIDVYGSGKALSNCKKIMTEKTPLRPDDPYSKAKVKSEFLLRKWSRNQGIPLAVLRFPGVYGPGDKQRSLISFFSRQIQNKKLVKIHGDGHVLRDYVFIDDVVKVVRMCIEKRVNRTMNIATGRSLSVRDIAKVLRSCLDPTATIRFIEKDMACRDKDILFDITQLVKTFPGLKIRPLKKNILSYAAMMRNDPP